MAIFRQVHLSFWDDPYTQSLNPLEKYFYLYLMTNPSTSACGIYELTVKDITYMSDLDKETINTFLQKFSDDGKIKYNQTNSEIILLNWLKYNNFKSSKTQICIKKELEIVKTTEFKEFVLNILNGKCPIDTPSIPHPSKDNDIDKEIDIEIEDEIEKEISSSSDIKKFNDFYGKCLANTLINNNFIQKEISDQNIQEFYKELTNKFTEDQILETLESYINKKLISYPLKPDGDFFVEFENWIRKQKFKPKEPKVRGEPKYIPEKVERGSPKDDIKTKEDAIKWLLTFPENVRMQLKPNRELMTVYEIKPEELKEKKKENKEDG